MKRVLYKVIVALGIAWVVAPPLLAHGIVVRAEPPPGGASPAAPGQVRLWFSEPVDPAFSAIQVLAPGSPDRVDLDDLRLTDDGSLAVTLPPGLPQGAYTVVWRVFTPGDGHHTSGSYSFGVGVPAGPAETLATERTPLSDAVRFLSLLGQALFAGVVVFRWTMQLEDRERLRGALFWVVQAARLGIGCGVLGALYLEVQALDAPVLDVLSTRWGLTWLMRAAIAGVVIVRADSWMRGRDTTAALLASAFLLLTTSLASHSAARFGLAGAAIDWLHLASASIWLGGVVCAAIALLKGERRFLSSFSILATAAVGMLAATGVWLGSEQVGSWRALLLTDYGRTLLLKLAAAGGALGLGGLHALGGGRGKTAAAEAALAALVVLGAAVLTNLPPAYSQPTDGAPMRVEQTKTVGGMTASIVLWPARLGPNTIDVRVHDSGGNPVAAAPVTAQFLPVDGGGVRSEVVLSEAGPGWYSTSGTFVTDPGEWQILLAVGERGYLNFDYFVGPDEALRPRGASWGAGVQAVGWLNRYALTFASGFLLLGASVWSGLAWRSLGALPDPRARLAIWLAPGLLLAGAIWLWMTLIF